MTDARRIALSALIPLAVLGAIQWVPYGHDHTSPPGGAEVRWDSPLTRRLAERACFDCHSDLTRWPWYASIAPVSWRIATHVKRGRRALDFTAFDAADPTMTKAAGEAGRQVTRDEMPPNDYRLLHPEARLSAAERRTLAAGLDRTFAAFVLRTTPPPSSSVR